jgi:hypothetical protein
MITKSFSKSVFGFLRNCQTIFQNSLDLKLVKVSGVEGLAPMQQCSEVELLGSDWIMMGLISTMDNSIQEFMI